MTVFAAGLALTATQQPSQQLCRLRKGGVASEFGQFQGLSEAVLSLLYKFPCRMESLTSL